jgi:single-strand DNA-binding protein
LYSSFFVKINKKISVCKRLQTQTFDYKPITTDYVFASPPTLHCQPNKGLAEKEKQFYNTKNNTNMNALKNKVQLVGNMGTAIEVREIASGKKVGNFTLATNETYKDANGQKVEETQWHKIVVWGKQAEIIEKYTSKGSELMLEGKLIHRSYDGKDGEKRYITEVEIRDFMLMGSNKTAAIV